ncbi:fasciclin domain-containing protein [Chitinophaga qingshengii]|uniref:Fasciclin domain-containing protein n=1 Tax=Chitinophaga qingshengii TaxID=1569794 RepID=A0ABR7TH18_9BACT|nr:fasciclin domain-containing protein [Chitinophaga qingshengii]MBC9929782.1 fasciclin domain-containing protein [Chitinophaga qingshengii]
MKRNYFIYTFALSLLFLSACRLKDAQVTPVGKPLEYAGPTRKIRELLDSTNLTVFKAIWKKANMDSVILEGGWQAYTLLAPTDEGFAKAGITLDKVNNMPVAQLDTLLFYHTLETWVSGDGLKNLIGNNSMRTLLKRSDLPGFYANDPYIYYHYLGYHGGKLMVNGQPYTLKALEATNGTIYVLDAVLNKPEQDMIDYLKSKPEFSYLLEAFRISDSIYQATWKTPMVTRLLMNTPENKSFTLFAPTNHAFQQAGFNTVDDLRQRALSYPVDYSYYDDHMFYVSPTTSLDSVLSANHLDFNSAMRVNVPLVLFSNDLTDNSLLPGFMIRAGSQMHEPPQYIRLSFANTGGSIMVKQLNSALPARKLVTTDLLFRNGVIHVIDDGLLMP